MVYLAPVPKKKGAGVVVPLAYILFRVAQNNCFQNYIQWPRQKHDCLYVYTGGGCTSRRYGCFCHTIVLLPVISFYKQDIYCFWMDIKLHDRHERYEWYWEQFNCLSWSQNNPREIIFRRKLRLDQIQFSPLGLSHTRVFGMVLFHRRLFIKFDPRDLGPLQ